MSKNAMSDKEIGGKFYGPEYLITTGTSVYDLALYHESITEFDPQTAYIKGDYFYTYKGILDPIVANNKPGIYIDPKNKRYVLIEVETDEEKELYRFETHVQPYKPEQIIDMLNRGEVSLAPIPESSKVFLPPITENDDILKRLIKQALKEKGVDIDSYKARFVDKNALFNFKQVLKGDTRLSMLLFDRGLDALNLRSTIILEEIDPAHPIGRALEEPIIASSDDTYDI